MQIVKLFIVVLATASLSACSLIGWETPDDMDGNYRDAVEIAEIEVPEGLSSDAIQQMFPIPDVTENVAVPITGKTPRPLPLTAGSQLDAVRLQSLGGENWAVVNFAPGQLWPQVRAFLVTSGIDVAGIDATGGLIDTTWVQLEGTEVGSRFRLRVESGVQRNTSELHILQQTQSGNASSLDWPESSDDEALEQTMLRNIAQYIANSAETSPVSMMADQSMTGAGRIEMEESSDGVNLNLALPFNRAWAATEKGFDDAGFRLDDKNRSAGLFYVTYLGPDGEEGGGWFSWLFGSDNDNPLIGQEYQIVLSSGDPDRVMISIVDAEGNPLEPSVQQGLLTLLQGNIT